MLPKLFVEVGNGGEAAFKDYLIYLVVCLAKKVTCLVGTYLVYIVYEAAAGVT